MTDVSGNAFNGAPVRHTSYALIELMIVVSIVGVVSTLALPVYSNYSIRVRVSEGLAVAAAAKSAAAMACVEDPTIAVLTPALRRTSC